MESIYDLTVMCLVSLRRVAIASIQTVFTVGFFNGKLFFKILIPSPSNLKREKGA